MRWILLLSLIISITALPAMAQTPPEGRNQIITTGTGRVDVTPDQVTVTVGVQVQRRGAADAWAEASLAANQMLARFQQLGVRKEQLKTSGVRLFPVYSALQGTEPQITGYRAAYNLTLTLDDLNLVGRVIDAGMESGANLLGGVSFGLRYPSTARRQALAMAVREAQEKANTIAQAAGTADSRRRADRRSRGHDPRTGLGSHARGGARDPH